ncbi:MAG: RNA pseudouridine synthase [Treponema sp.]|nr:RNA pseudouridine synthase [Treponema sp.]
MPQLLIEVIHEPRHDAPFLVLKKPSGLPSAPLAPGEDSAITQAVRLFPQLSCVRGKKDFEYGLLHRLDTDTAGLLLVAETDEAYRALCGQQSCNRFYKTYRASCVAVPRLSSMLPGFPGPPSVLESPLHGKPVTVRSRFRPFGPKGASVRPVVPQSGRAALKKSGAEEYATRIVFLGNGTVRCQIARGARHQVRCHLAWLGFPVQGDRLYNPFFVEGERLQFFATELSFENPYDGKPFTVAWSPP